MATRREFIASGVATLALAALPTSRIELLRNRIVDTTLRCGLLDERFLDIARGIEYRLGVQDSRGCNAGVSGNYIDKRTIDLKFLPGLLSLPDAAIVSMYVPVQLHELAHRFWVELAPGEQDGFRKIVVDSYARFRTADSQLYSGGSRQAHVLERHGFTDRTYESVIELLARQLVYSAGYSCFYTEKHEFYIWNDERRKLFGEYVAKMIDTQFNKTEAFAILFVHGILNPDRIALGDRAFYDIGVIPENMRHYYRGFLHEKFFI